MLKPGSLMGGGAEKAPASLGEQDKSLLVQAALNLACGQYSEAFLLLSRLAEQKPHPAVFFNLALCHFKGAAGPDALPGAQKCLEKALAAVQALPEPPEPPELRAAAFKALAAAETQGEAYAGPMQPGLLAWPQLAKIRILRLLIDVYAASGQWSEVTRLAQALGGGKYANVEAALARARQN